MASVKEFVTRFNIGAVWTGQRGVNQATAALTKTASTAQRVNTRVKGMYKSMVGAVATYDLASRAVSGFTNLLLKSVAAASEAQQIYDDIGLSLERNAKRYKNLWGKSATEQAAILKENEEALIRQAELLEQTGHDAETALAGWGKIIGTLALSPKQMIEQSKAFSDVLSYMYGANATQEESIALGEAWSDMITRGNIAFARRLDMSDSEITALQNINKARKKGEITQDEAIKRRQAVASQAAAKFAGETERVFGKPSGKVAQMYTQIGNIFEEMGAPFVQRAPELAESFSRIAKAMKPFAEDLAPKISGWLASFANWFAEHTDEIIAYIDKVAWAVGKLWDILVAIQQGSEAFFKPMYDFLKDKLWPIIEKIVNALEKIWSIQSGIPPGTKVTPTVPPAMDWRYGGTPPAGTQQAGEAAAEQMGAGWGTPRAPKIGGASSASLKSEREAIAQQLANDPGLQQLLMASVKAEVGDQSAETQLMYIESVMNRAAAERAAGIKSKGNLRELLTSGYYPAATRKRLGHPVGAGEALGMQGLISQALGGSNASNFATGNESANVGYASRAAGKWMPILARGGYERFVGEPWTKDWVEQKQKETDAAKTTMMKGSAAANRDPYGVQYGSWNAPPPPPPPKPLQFPKTSLVPAGSKLKDMIKEMNIRQRVGGASGGTNVASNPVINVHGVPAGSEAAIGAAVQKAIQDPNRRLVEQIKAARNYESRLGYV